MRFPNLQKLAWISTIKKSYMIYQRYRITLCILLDILIFDREQFVFYKYISLHSFVDAVACNFYSYS